MSDILGKEFRMLADQAIKGKTDLIGWVSEVLNDAGGSGLRGSDIASMIWSWRLRKDGW
jgi:hypothetical protein